MKNGLLLITLLLCSCVSYYDSYEQDYYASNFSGYNYYNSPLRLRGLTENDFYMLDNYPGDYLDTRLWEAFGSLGRFGVHSILQELTR